MNQIPKDFSMQQALAFAGSAAGQQLLRLIRQSNQTQLEDAVRLASEGNTEGAKAALSTLLSDPSVQDILKNFGG